MLARFLGSFAALGFVERGGVLLLFIFPYNLCLNSDRLILLRLNRAAKDRLVYLLLLSGRDDDDLVRDGSRRRADHDGCVCGIYRGRGRGGARLGDDDDAIRLFLRRLGTCL